MIRLLCVFLTIMTNTFIQSCNLCLGKEKPTFLKQQAYDHVECNCPCWQYTKSKTTNTCFVCGHRVIPEKINFSGKTKPITSKKQKSELNRTYNRWS